MEHQLWNPISHPVQRLLQLLDTLFISRNVALQAQGFVSQSALSMFPTVDFCTFRNLPNDTPLPVEAFLADQIPSATQLKELSSHSSFLFRVAKSCFKADTDTKIDLQALIYAVMAYFRKADCKFDVGDFQRAERLISSAVGVELELFDAPEPDDSSNGQECRAHWAALAKEYEDVRELILLALAQAGEQLPVEIHRRVALALHRVPSPWCDIAVAEHRLIQWCLETRGAPDAADELIYYCNEIASTVADKRQYKELQQSDRETTNVETATGNPVQRMRILVQYEQWWGGQLRMLCAHLRASVALDGRAHEDFVKFAAGLESHYCTVDNQLPSNPAHWLEQHSEHLQTLRALRQQIAALAAPVGQVAEPGNQDPQAAVQLQLDPVAKLVLLYLNKKRLQILPAKTIGEEADPDRVMDKKTVSRCLKTLRQHGLVREDTFGWSITDIGRKFAAELLQNP